MRALRSCRSARSTPGSWRRPRGACASGSWGSARNNSQREYYLTDVVARRGAGRRSASKPCRRPSALEVMGVNDKIQLAQVEAGYRRNGREELMLAGATLGGSRAHRHTRRRSRSAATCSSTSMPCSIGKVHLAARRQDRTQLHDHAIPASAPARKSSPTASSITPSSAQNCRIGPFARLAARIPSLHRERAHRQFRRSEEQRDRRGQQGQSFELRGRLARGQAT